MTDAMVNKMQIMRHSAASWVTSRLTKRPPPTDPKDCPVYQHSPLRDGEFRVIIVSPGRPDEPVRLQVQHRRVENDHDYIALSYVWGDTANLQPVWIGDSVIWTTYNLFQFLRHIRHPSKPGIFWADAICINQTENGEKSRQLMYMTQIYPQASNVYYWLGDADDSVEDAFRTLRAWAHTMAEVQPPHKLRREFTVLDDRKIHLAGRARQELASVQQGELTAIGKLLQRPWFSRVWILQEACVPIDSYPVLICDEHILPWQFLYWAYLALKLALGMPQFIQYMGPGLTHVTSILTFCWQDLEEPEFMRLSILISLAGGRNATNARDKVFALLGLAARRGFEYPAPNYDWSLEQVGVVYTRACITVDRTLAILKTASLWRRSGRLPSWSFRLDAFVDHPSSLGRNLNNQESERKLIRQYDASAGREPCMFPANGQFDPILRLQGLRVDAIKFVHRLDALVPYLSREPASWRHILNRIDEFCKTMKLFPKYPYASSSMRDVMIRTLCADAFFATLPHRRALKSQHEEDEVYGAYMTHVSSEKDRGSRPIASCDRLMEYISSHFSFSDKDTPDLDMQSNLYIPHAWLDKYLTAKLLGLIRESWSDDDQRQLVFTKKGYVGLASTHSRPGVELAILFGSSIPFCSTPLTTKIGSVYQLHGEAYVQGVMHGEMTGEESESSAFCLI